MHALGLLGLEPVDFFLVRGVEALAGFHAVQSLGQQLVQVLLHPFGAHGLGNLHRPHAAVAGAVARPLVVVAGAEEHALARVLGGPPVKRGAQVVHLGADEGLDQRHVFAGDGVQLRKFVHPAALQLQVAVFVAQVQVRVAEIVAGQHPAERALAVALRAFEHQHVVELAARPQNTRHHAHDEPLAHAGQVLAPRLAHGLGVQAQRLEQPHRKALHAVPLQGLQAVAHGVESVVHAHRLERLANAVGARALHPVVAQHHVFGQLVVVHLAPDAGRAGPGRGLELPHLLAELIEAHQPAESRVFLEAVQHVFARGLGAFLAVVRPAVNGQLTAGLGVGVVAHQLGHHLAPLFQARGIVLHQGRWHVPPGGAQVGAQLVGAPGRIYPYARCRIGHVPAVRLDAGANGRHHPHLVPHHRQHHGQLGHGAVAWLLLGAQVGLGQLRGGLALGGLLGRQALGGGLGFQRLEFVARDFLSLAVGVGAQQHARLRLAHREPQPVRHLHGLGATRPGAAGELVAQQVVHHVGALLALGHHHHALGVHLARGQVQRARFVPALPVPA